MKAEDARKLYSSIVQEKINRSCSDYFPGYPRDGRVEDYDLFCLRRDPKCQFCTTLRTYDETSDLTFCHASPTYCDEFLASIDDDLEFHIKPKAEQRRIQSARQRKRDHEDYQDRQILKITRARMTSKEIDDMIKRFGV